MAGANHIDDPIRSILVATDGSDSAKDALERGLQLAEATGANVHILSVVDTTSNPMRFGVADVAELHETRERVVDEIVAAIDNRDIEVHGSIRRGHPASTILTYADENAIDLLVIGRTGRGRVAEALLGSTADRLVRQASIPVIVVPADEDRDEDGRQNDSSH
ncbi:universal stress protein [Natronorubrum sp. JWXQ-INN-674]|uniref:Universal stress protein n=1 Tax=Natronorubrum halalkaliphilum TaxID=2691917 RepID=A0A6B0VGK7_9EURY|nr:universal stress protein [Natronorubrum halalkaliphilum]MXV60513.1 universal stress protein [Natronorubrum halalkaliphilum]